METDRFKDCLATSYARLRELADGDPSLAVPSCPEWTLADLVSHVAHVYLHKVETIRHGQFPDPWPPEPTGESPVELLERGYRELEAELGARPASEHALTWYEPDQTVGFWHRRMTHETLVHGWDAELAVGASSRPVPDDLAFDGIEEILVIFLRWACEQWPEDFADTLSQGDGSVLVSAGTADWLVRWDATRVTLGPTAPAGGDLVSEAVAASGGLAPVEPNYAAGSQPEPLSAPLATVSGSPEAVLRWLWRRAGDEVVAISGDVGKVAQMRTLLEAGTQ
jgi:uncharacterized protein (TIGR03083 family)